MNKEQQIASGIAILRKMGLANLPINHPVFKERLIEGKKVDIPMTSKSNKIIDITIEEENGQKMTVGKLVTHRTVPQLGLGLVVAESKKHKGYWIVQWCDKRFSDVGELGIDRDYLVIV